ncbi:hypothetical protein N657DRAFT_662049 [Parathielavia appendiculata]|uniref:Uncharacterized protein n=1 Tax=Parathielavia appendiculata TaxID=2587402 RepID=A0AAN6U355_9PEZI|nr:hypothetical protein N657DRAFT_662049 [Parathielavia appendiculata]
MWKLKTSSPRRTKETRYAGSLRRSARLQRRLQLETSIEPQLSGVQSKASTGKLLATEPVGSSRRARLTKENLTLLNEMGRRKWTRGTNSTQAPQNGILNQVHSKPPKNLEDRRKGFARSRKTASPQSVQLLKTHSDPGYPRAFNQAFTAFPRNTEFNNGLSAPQPDFWTTRFSVALPHIAGEWKGRGKDMDEAKMQSAYDGAALTYARNQALSYLGKPRPPNGVLEYHQYPTASTNLTSSYEDIKKGWRHLSYALRD